MSTPVEGGRRVTFGVFGFPTHLDLSFVIVMGLIGWLSGIDSVRGLVLWIVIAAFAVLIHELGHAVVARTTGARPVIALTGFGGVTTYSPPRPVSRARSLAISLAGPFAGLAVGVPLAVLQGGLVESLVPGSLAHEALSYAVFTTIAWSVLNLLPVLPLDGGQAVREILPGPPEVRARRAAIVSLVMLLPLLALAVLWRQPFLAVFLVLFGVSNVQALSAGSGHDGAPGPGGSAQAEIPVERSVVGLLWRGSTLRARAVLEAAPADRTVDLAVHGAVMATTGQAEQGLALLAQERLRRPDDVNVISLVVLTHALLHDWDAVVADLTSDDAALIPLAVVERAVEEAAGTGRQDVVARLNAVPRPAPRPSGQ
jgi:stage IV sporulation protein FB